MLMAAFAYFSSASDMSKLSGFSFLEMMNKGVVLGLSPITSTSIVV